MLSFFICPSLVTRNVILSSINEYIPTILKSVSQSITTKTNTYLRKTQYSRTAVHLTENSVLHPPFLTSPNIAQQLYSAISKHSCQILSSLSACEASPFTKLGLGQNSKKRVLCKVRNNRNVRPVILLAPLPSVKYIT